jgi:hypothetical protein
VPLKGFVRRASVVKATLVKAIRVSLVNCIVNMYQRMLSEED